MQPNANRVELHPRQKKKHSAHTPHGTAIPKEREKKKTTVALLHFAFNGCNHNPLVDWNGEW